MLSLKFSFHPLSEGPFFFRYMSGFDMTDRERSLPLKKLNDG